MAQSHQTVTIRCRRPWAYYLLFACRFLPDRLLQPWANLVAWLACWQIDYGSGWQRLDVQIEVSRDNDDDDSDGGTLVPAYASA